MRVGFGACVSVYRADGQTTGPDDDRRVQAAARSLQFAEPDRIGPYDHLNLRFGGARRTDGLRGLSVGLTEYFKDDTESGNVGLNPTAIIERERPVAEQFAEALATVLGEEYEVSPFSGYW